MNCPKCGRPVDAHVLNCITDGWFVGFPNVRAADAPEEREALELRYRKATSTDADGRQRVLEEFEERLRSSGAVINMRLADLHAFLVKPNALYTTYSLGVSGETRRPADPDHDQERRAVEAKLFGKYAKQIRYAALSLDGTGVISYGPLTIRLRELAIEDRSSLLEENSFDFAEHHQLLPKTPVPKGYRCSWGNRHRLAVAKLGSSVRPSDGDREFAQLVLKSEGDRTTDRFIEVHVYGPFDAAAIESVRGRTKAASKQERADVARVKDLLAQHGLEWIEDA